MKSSRDDVENLNENVGDHEKRFVVNKRIAEMY